MKSTGLIHQLEKDLATYDGTPFAFRDWQGGRCIVGNGPPRFAVHFKTRQSLARCFADSSLGFGEAYARGDIAVEGDLEEALFALAGWYMSVEARGGILADIRGVLTRTIARTLTREKADIEHHYGLGDAFYRFFWTRACNIPARTSKRQRTPSMSRRSRKSSTPRPSCTCSPASVCSTSDAAGAR